ncbi:MAG TPA: tolB protein, partial [Polyangiaceae bacterium]|nr:tolB protein [Polyangiaceae bacterium]
FLSVGKDPVYQKTLLVDKALVRVTAHRITDALLGALTGRPGGFASRFAFSAKWGRHNRVFTMDADGHDLTPISDQKATSIAPVWGAGEGLFYLRSDEYAPFKLFRYESQKHVALDLPFKSSIYSVAFNRDYTKLAIAVAENNGSSIFVGDADGKNLTRVSKTPLSTHPVFSPSGKLAWIGGNPQKDGNQRVYIDGKAVSPAGFTAAAPAFCDTEDGIRLVYAVGVGNDHQDLVMSAENGQGIARLTQGQGSNSYPACSPDGRMLAFFSTRQNKKGLYMMSLKRWRTQKVISQYGESLRWAPLPAPTAAASAAP